MLEHFTEDEFMMGDENVFHKMDEMFLQLLDELRDQCGFAMVLNSTYRSPAYNRSIGGASRSKHLDGVAADIACTDSSKRARIVREALELGLTVGVAKTFIHVDSRATGQIMFTY